jgi:pyrroline-5-carboxylate reductase
MPWAGVPELAIDGKDIGLVQKKLTVSREFSCLNSIIIDSISMKLGFIGGGQMCEGIIKGLIVQNNPALISVSEPYEQRRQYLKQAFPCAKITSHNQEIIAESEIVILSCKPQQLSNATDGISLDSRHLFISICAGVPITRLEQFLSPESRVVRVMPNLPAMVGEGASGFCVNANCTAADVEIVKGIFKSVGCVVEQVPEALMDVVTGVSGSGPAYVCLFIEAMADAAVKYGMPRDAAIRLAAQTCVGAGKLVLTGGDSNHPAVVKDKICSPGGTSIAAVAALEEKGFRAAVLAGVTAAIEKGKDLGKL